MTSRAAVLRIGGREQLDVLHERQGAHGGSQALDLAACRGRRQMHHRLPPEKLAAQRIGRVHGDQPLAEYADPLAQPLRLVQVVGAEEDRAPLASQRLDEVAHGLRGLRVERGRRLIEKHHRRLVEQRPRDRQLLLHPLAERARFTVPSIPQVEQPQILLDLPLHILHAVHVGEELQVVPRAQSIVQPRRLGEDADLRLDRQVRLAHFQVVDPGAARAGADQAGEHAHGGRLAGAVRPQEAEHLALLHLQAEAIDGPDFLAFFAAARKILTQSFGANH